MAFSSISVAPPMPEHSFLELRRDETWIVRSGTSRMARRTDDAGTSIAISSGSLMRFEIHSGVDDPLPPPFDRAGEEELPARMRNLLETLRGPLDSLLPNLDAAPEAASIRVVTRIRGVVTPERDQRAHVDGSVVVVIHAPGQASVTGSPDLLQSRLVTASDPAGPEIEHVDPMSLPILWIGGSGAVMLHEVVGHPAERGIFTPDLPTWIEVTDSPTGGFAPAEIDDAGRATSARVLSRGESPSSFRRASFRDVPLIRMSNLSVSSSGAPFEIPQRRIEVDRVG
ncbi:MAG: hypothetical protein WBX15_14045, partial [Thermoanaerobaculia bacterium]